ncbi:hypothetical protein N431DRAFT_119107 [Stipitochalara longipes BDJ]|nr:hypothetical protein N431DRAFT_119107 [Stipitochalara longipes BDJ]
MELLLTRSFPQSRWRARDGDALKGGETRAQGQFTIKQGRLEPGSSIKVFKIAFVMVIDGKHLTFEGTHAAELDPPGPDFDLVKEWDALLNPSWEAGGAPTPYQPGSIIQIKHKPKPVPAPASGVAVVQARPDWAWDITGKWTLTPLREDRFFLSSIGVPKNTQLTMSIFLANNPRHTKIQRQYWAIFKFGESMEGCMRFCMPEEGGSKWSAKEFDEACVLNDDDWVGPAPQGSPKMAYRWRVKNCDTGYQPRWYTSEFQHEGLTFAMGDDGKLSFNAVMTVGYSPRVLQGVKTGEVEPRKNNAATVKTVWNSYADRGEP